MLERTSEWEGDRKGLRALPGKDLKTIYWSWLPIGERISEDIKVRGTTPATLYLYTKGRVTVTGDNDKGGVILKTIRTKGNKERESEL